MHSFFLEQYGPAPPGVHQNVSMVSARLHAILEETMDIGQKELSCHLDLCMYPMTKLIYITLKKSHIHHSLLISSSSKLVKERSSHVPQDAMSIMLILVQICTKRVYLKDMNGLASLSIPGVPSRCAPCVVLQHGLGRFRVCIPVRRVQRKTLGADQPIKSPIAFYHRDGM